MKIRTDCKYYKNDRPCRFHKIDGRVCKNCSDCCPIKERILIIKLEALGDVLRTTSILPALKNKYPYSHITWVTKKDAIALLMNNNFIDSILNTEDNYLEFVLAQKYDISLCLDLELLSATINTLARASVKKGFIADAKGRVIPAGRRSKQWYSMSMNDAFKKANRRSYFEHIYQICGLNPPYFKPQYKLTEEQLKLAFQLKNKHKLDSYSKIIGINTGAGSRWQLKRWVLEYYINLIKLIKNKFPQTGILLYGGLSEENFNRNIVEAVGNQVIDTGCDNSLENFCALLSLSDIFLTPDSLGMHLSTALDKITLVLVGPTSPWEIDVFGKGEVIYSNNLDCISCYLSTCDKKINCMNSLSAESIFTILEKYIKDESRNH